MKKCGDCIWIFEEEKRCLSSNEKKKYKDGKCRTENDAEGCPAFLYKHGDPQSKNSQRRITRYINIGE